MTDWLTLWLANPERWHAHPEAYPWGLVAAGVLFVVLAAAFWLKGRFWPDD